jgi:AAA domain
MKSSLMLAWACSAVLGQPHGKFKPTAPGDVIVYNVEDDKTEQRRRLSAVLRQFSATPADICGKLVRVGPSGVGTLFAYNLQTGLITPTPGMNNLRALIAERRPALLIADPLAELHTAPENDNTALLTVVAEFRALAVEFDMAIILAHHTRKGTVIPGDPDTARGASAIIGAGRIVLTVVGMSEDDAQSLAMPTDRKTRSNYVRLDDAKQNYAAIGDSQWYEKTLCHLDNGETVPAAVPWRPPNAFAKLTTSIIDAILSKVEAGPYEGGRYSPAPQAKDRAVWIVVQQFCPDMTDDEVKCVIATWIKNCVLVKKMHKDPKDRHEHPGIFVGNRPGDTWEM